MSNRVRIKLGPIEFEVEGDSDLIERERAQFFSLLPQAITAVSPVVSNSSQMLEAAKDIIEISDPPSLPTSELHDNPHSYDSIVAFLKEKSFSSDLERVLGVTYYIDQLEGVSPFTSRDIEAKFTDARLTKPSNISHAINKNIAKGFLCESKEKKEGLKSFYLSLAGIEWCQNYTPSETSTPKKIPKSRRLKTNTESFLINIPLEDLHLDNYCDVPSLKNLDEQILVVMFMYTKEKDVEYFSFEDIVSILKTKFKVSATSRQVQYFFEKGGTKFDKKTEKKRAYHKLMSIGIKEAEKIISQQKESTIVSAD
ncbi:hypothetical protein [Desulfosporosinus sp. FKA]|uniref:hypothetical protein n=1 Tax=Desulfosporosinus sp. FKA TaxID=1969834 RepID=UPI000B49CA65|nr:hypothetical protein [Desulfosporosinus sp. FKA]